MAWLVLTLLGCREVIPPKVEIPRRSPHQAWERTLSRVVDDAGNVNYARLARERQALDNYVAWVSRPSHGRLNGAPAHAFNLNAFTALALYQVLERDIQSSVTEVPSWLPGRGAGFWYSTAFIVGGRELSLWDVGHEKLTHAFQDYRDFLVIPVMARSGPPVRAKLYTTDGLGGQLEDQAQAFMMSDRGLTFDGDKPLFNAVFKRYDFEFDLYTHGTDLCTLASHHTRGPRKRKLLEAAEQGCDHGYMPFNWTLNQSGGTP